MRLTNTHRQFWLNKHAPAWARNMQDGCEANIDRCVNQHAPIPPINGMRHEWHHASNLCSLLGSVRRRGCDVLAYLDRVSQSPGTVIRPARRAGYAKKWANRIRASRRSSAASYRATGSGG